MPDIQFMKALTVWQPWAMLLAIGAKKYETRSWETRYRGPIAIHAAAKPIDYLKYGIQFAKSAIEALKGKGFNPPDLPCGYIVATAELIGCWEIMCDAGEDGDQYCPALITGYHAVSNERLFGDWTPGRFAWEFANMQLLPEPIPCKGAQGLWNWKRGDAA